MKRQCERGLSLVNVLLLITVLTALIFAVIGASFAIVNVGTRLDNEEACRNLLDKALSTAVDQLRRDPRWGLASASPLVVASADGNGKAVVTFDGRAEGHSVNNLEGEKAQLGWNGAPVPIQSVHLVVTAELGGVKKRMDALISNPRFPFVIASSGAVRSNGPLLVACVSSSDSLDDGLDSGALRPGHVLSNGRDPDAVALLGSDIRVTGDVRSCGGVQLAPAVSVGGLVREHAEARALPRIPLEEQDPGTGDGVTVLEQQIYSGLPVTGQCRRDGSLIVNGDLALDDGLLFVNGDLEVHGVTTGRGMVVCMGRVLLKGGAALAGANLCALLARGDVVVHGDGGGQERNFFRGLVYTEGDFRARDVTLVGAFVGNSSSGSKMQLDNVSAVYDGAAVDFEMRYPWGGLGLAGLTVDGIPISPVIPHLSEFYDGSTDSYVLKPELLADVQYSYRGKAYSRSELLRQFKQKDPPLGYSDWGAAFDATETDFQQKMTDQLKDIAERYASTRDAALRDGKVSLDLSKFLSDKDRVRIVARRDLN